GLHPIGGFVASVLISGVVTAVYYLVTRYFFGRTAGLIAAFLKAILLPEIVRDWSMVPSYSSELFIPILWWLFHLYWQGKTQVFPWIALIGGIFTSMHPIMFPFYIVFICLMIITKKVPSIKT